MKTIIYLRTSTEDQNPQNQLSDCKTLVKGDYKVVEEKQSAFRDKKRPLFDSLRKEIQRGNVSEIVCWDLDRLYRNRKLLVQFFEFCKIYKCRVSSFRQQWLNQLNEMPEPFGEIMQSLMIQIMGWLAEDESQKKSDRVKIAFKNSTKKWGRKPLENVEEQVFDLYKKGKSMREITKKVYYWDKSRNKKFVSVGAVHKIINKFNGKSS